MSITMGQLASKFSAAAQKVSPAREKALRTLAQVGVGYVKEEIQNAHAVDTGTMLNSTTAERDGNGYLIGPTVSYAPYVALGTSRMPGRPFHTRAARRLEKDLKNVDFVKEIGL